MMIAESNCDISLWWGDSLRVELSGCLHGYFALRKATGCVHPGDPDSHPLFRGLSSWPSLSSV